MRAAILSFLLTACMILSPAAASASNGLENGAGDAGTSMPVYDLDPAPLTVQRPSNDRGAFIAQVGEASVATIAQTSPTQYARIDQSGDTNRADVTQSGRRHPIGRGRALCSYQPRGRGKHAGPAPIRRRRTSGVGTAERQPQHHDAGAARRDR